MILETKLDVSYMASTASSNPTSDGHPNLEPNFAGVYDLEQHSKRHSEFWFEDGSIVLSVEKTLFRVHRTVLIAHSEIFADIFSIPAPASGSEIMEGCPVVHLPDQADDFVSLLRALYNPVYFDSLPTDAEVDSTISFVAGILRLSAKYSIPTLRRKCIELLRVRFPSLFAAFEPNFIGVYDLEQHRKRHPEFWFEDGSIVLSVEKTLFRVHRTVLVTHSEIFADMFSIPVPTTDSETVEGCSVVQLPDQADDFVNLLRALYNPVYFDSLPTDAKVDSTISFVAGILRLSTKYSIATLRRKCIELLKVKFPSSFAAFSAMTSTRSRFGHYGAPSRMGVINLARETNVPEILPFAFYLAARLSRNLILSGALSWRDKAICLAGRERLWDAQRTLSLSFLLNFKPSASCRSQSCNTASRPHALWHEIEQRNRFPISLDYFKPWGDLNVCSECLANAMEQHQTGREKVWDMLPDMFELGSWEEVRRVQNR